MICKGEEAKRELYVHFEGPNVDIVCPSGSYLDLGAVKGEECRSLNAVGFLPSSGDAMT